MDINKHHDHLISYTGFKFGREWYPYLYLHLNKLLQENNFKKIFFWGKILGLERDYMITYGINDDALIDRKFYYSLEGLKWILLPKPNKKHCRLASLCKTSFVGNPALKIPVIDETPKNEIFVQPKDIKSPKLLKIRNKENPITYTNEKLEDEKLSMEETKKDNEETKKKITKYLKEEDRLAVVVQWITEDALIVPRGAIIRDLTGRVYFNKHFSGLSLDDSTDLKNYLHYRFSKRRWNKNLLTRKDFNFSLDFMDTINDQLPAENDSLWIIQRDKWNSIIILKNLIWPGMTFYHEINSSEFGSIYIGTGQKNLDLPFWTMGLDIDNLMQYLFIHEKNTEEEIKTTEKKQEQELAMSIANVSKNSKLSVEESKEQSEL